MATTAYDHSTAKRFYDGRGLLWNGWNGWNVRLYDDTADF